MFEGGADPSAGRQLRAGLESREVGVGLNKLEVERDSGIDNDKYAGSDYLCVRNVVVELDEQTRPCTSGVMDEIPCKEAGGGERLRICSALLPPEIPGGASGSWPEHHWPTISCTLADAGNRILAPGLVLRNAALCASGVSVDLQSNEQSETGGLTVG